VLATTLKAGESAEYEPAKKRSLYLVPAAGSVEINGVRVNARDALRSAMKPSSRLRHWKIRSWCWSTPRKGAR